MHVFPDLVNLLNENKSLSLGIEVVGLYRDCLLLPSIAGRYLLTHQILSVPDVKQQVFADPESLVESIVEVGTTLGHSSVNTVHCLFLLTQEHVDIAKVILDVISPCRDPMRERIAARLREEFPAPKEEREFLASTQLTYRLSISDLMERCHQYLHSRYYPFTKIDYGRFMEDLSISKELPRFEFCAFAAHREWEE